MPLVFIRPSRDGRHYVIGYGGRQAGIHTGFHTITLVLYIGSLPNLEGEEPYLFWGH
jgi:hypothetical protein